MPKVKYFVKIKNPFIANNMKLIKGKIINTLKIEYGFEIDIPCDNTYYQIPENIYYLLLKKKIWSDIRNSIEFKTE